MILEMSQIAIQGPKIFLSKWYLLSHKYWDMNNHNTFFTRFLWKKSHILYLLHVGFSIIGIGRYEKSHIDILLVFYRYQPIRKFECIGLYLYWLIWKKAYRLYTEICKNCIHKFKQWINYFENNRQNLSTHVEVVISKNNRNRLFWEITGIWDDRLLFSITGIDDQGLNDKMDLKVFSIMSKYFF